MIVKTAIINKNQLPSLGSFLYRQHETIYYFRKTLKNRILHEYSFYSPFLQDPSSHMNLGAMLHLVGKLSEAENHYLRALSLRPHDQATAINIQRLHRVMVSRGLPIKHELTTEN